MNRDISRMEFRTCSVYFVPEDAKHPVRLVAECRDHEDAEAIARFFRDRDKAYTYLSTDHNGKPTVYESLF